MIRLQFVCEKALSSYAISWFSSGHLSHVDCLLQDGSLLGARSDRVAGIAPGVQIRPSDYAPFCARVVIALDVRGGKARAYREFLQAQLGKPYDHEAIWGFVLDRDWRERDSWICSELQAAAIEHAGIVPPLYLAANKITPVALALAASAMGAKVDP